MSAAASGPASGAPSRAALPAFLGRFTVLRGAPRELWVLLLVKLLVIAAYQVMNLTFVLWLSADLGYSDQWAGFLVAGWSAAMTLFAVFAGSLADAIGARKAILLGLAVTVAARAVMTFSTLKWLALAGGLLPLALGEALTGPVLAAAVRRYSTTSQRSMAFSLFYAMMNVGFILAYHLFDGLRQALGEPQGHLTLPWLRLEFTTYRALFLISFLIEAAIFPVAWFGLREGVEATDQGVRIGGDKPRRPRGALGTALSTMARDALTQGARIFSGLWRQRGFYQFLAFLGLAALVRLIFVSMYYTYPKFGIRELGEAAPVGALFSINSYLVLLLAPLLGALVQRIPAYRMVTVGSAVAAASVFIMALPPRWFQPLADGALGHGIADLWLGADTRFSPDDFPNTPALAASLLSPSNSVSTAVIQTLSGPTRTLLRRPLPPHNPALEPHPSSALFAAGDITPAFAARLSRDPNPATASVSAFLLRQFSPATLALLADTKAPEPQLQAALAEDLNRVLKGGTLYEAERFAAVPLSPPALALAPSLTGPASGQLLPNQTRLLNRLLLEDTYGADLAHSAHPLRVALAHDLSALISNGPLDRLPGFPRPALAGTDTPPRGARLARLNRRLLEDAFPSGIAKNRLDAPGSVNPYYVMILLYLVLLSVGESIYSPRLYEYAAAIAPKGQEASYLSLSYLPFFLAKLPVATLSGVLLARFCPETGPRDSAGLWLIIGLTAAVAPVGLLALRRFIQAPEAGRPSIF